MELVLNPHDATVTLLEDWQLPRWTTRVDASLIQDACFRETYIWQSGSVVCVGAAEHIWFLDLDTGVVRRHLDLKTIDHSGFSEFGHFGQAILSDGTDLLIVLTYSHVIAVDATLSVRWIAKEIAIDGITGADGCSQPDRLIVSAEIDCQCRNGPSRWMVSRCARCQKWSRTGEIPSVPARLRWDLWFRASQ